MANEVRLTTDPVRLKALEDATLENKLAKEEAQKALIRERGTQQRLEAARTDAYEGVLKPGTVVTWMVGPSRNKPRKGRIQAAYVTDYGRPKVEYDVINILKDGSLGQTIHLHCGCLVIHDGNLSTWDDNSLTRLVFLAHDWSVRVDLRPYTFTDLEILLTIRYQRKATPGARWASLHPSLEEAVTDWRNARPERG